MWWTLPFEKANNNSGRPFDWNWPVLFKVSTLIEEFIRCFYLNINGNTVEQKYNHSNHPCCSIDHTITQTYSSFTCIIYAQQWTIYPSKYSDIVLHTNWLRRLRIIIVYLYIWYIFMLFIELRITLYKPCLPGSMHVRCIQRMLNANIRFLMRVRSRVDTLIRMFNIIHYLYLYLYKPLHFSIPRRVRYVEQPKRNPSAFVKMDRLTLSPISTTDILSGICRNAIDTSANTFAVQTAINIFLGNINTNHDKQLDMLIQCCGFQINTINYAELIYLQSNHPKNNVTPWITHKLLFSPCSDRCTRARLINWERTT